MSSEVFGVEPEGVDSSMPVPPRSWGEIAGEVILVLPNVTKLFARLMRDPRVPIRRKILVGAVGAYVVSPIDLIPDFFIGIGRLDDIILVSLAVDHLMRGTDEEIVLDHWDGSVDALDMVRSLFAWGAAILPDRVRRFLPR
ncbi:MAG: DUF1232 domain-containing protein [Armatimonadetes bacterium]|nr:MAG: DUF1232 domain-containing protein [Armatimonadota bacterium]